MVGDNKFETSVLDGAGIADGMKITRTFTENGLEQVRIQFCQFE